MAKIYAQDESGPGADEFARLRSASGVQVCVERFGTECVGVVEVDVFEMLCGLGRQLGKGVEVGLKPSCARSGALHGGAILERERSFNP
jgi:hypothetical protein